MRNKKVNLIKEKKLILFIIIILIVAAIFLFPAKEKGGIPIDAQIKYDERSLVEARNYQKLEDNLVQCNLCFRGCILKEGEKDFTDEFYTKLSSAKLEPVLQTLKIIKEEGVWLEIVNLEQAREIAQEVGMHYVSIGNVPGHKANSTYCPQCGNILISRVHFMVLANNIVGGRCRFCGHKIPGIWRDIDSTRSSN